MRGGSLILRPPGAAFPGDMTIENQTTRVEAPEA